MSSLRRFGSVVFFEGLRIHIFGVFCRSAGDRDFLSKFSHLPPNVSSRWAFRDSRFLVIWLRFPSASCVFFCTSCMHICVSVLAALFFDCFPIRRLSGWYQRAMSASFSLSSPFRSVSAGASGYLSMSRAISAFLIFDIFTRLVFLDHIFCLFCWF